MKELFINELIRQILSGECKIGERLPTEREMERKMKVSRTIINSALTELARLGFVEIIPRHGAFVGDFIRNGNIDTLISIMNFNGGKLDRKTFDSFANFRTVNECECAYLAALNRTEEDLVIIRDIYKKILDATDSSVVAQLKIEFHHAIYSATGNTIYPLVFNSFNKLALTFNEVLFRNLGCECAPKYLNDLITAIEQKQPNKARAIMTTLITTRISQLARFYFEE